MYREVVFPLLERSLGDPAELLEAHPDFDANTAYTTGGTMLLHHAALSGHMYVVQGLLALGAKADALDSDGDSVLCLACSGVERHQVRYFDAACCPPTWLVLVQLVKHLLANSPQARSTVNWLTSAGTTALHCAAGREVSLE